VTEGEYTWRCICCGARLMDVVPPLGQGEIKCPKCGEMMYLSVTPVPEFDTDGGVWYVKRWWGTPVMTGAMVYGNVTVTGRA
jgi:phage FluMu protein Com